MKMSKCQNTQFTLMLNNDAALADVQILEFEVRRLPAGVTTTSNRTVPSKFPERYY